MNTNLFRSQLHLGFVLVVINHTVWMLPRQTSRTCLSSILHLKFLSLMATVLQTESSLNELKINLTQFSNKVWLCNLSLRLTPNLNELKTFTLNLTQFFLWANLKKLKLKWSLSRACQAWASSLYYQSYLSNYQDLRIHLNHKWNGVTDLHFGCTLIVTNNLIFWNLILLKTHDKFPTDQYY